MTPEVIDAPGGCGQGGHAWFTTRGIRALTSRYDSLEADRPGPQPPAGEDAVARCFEAWNAEDPAARAKAVAAAWTEDGGYTDPLADVRGHEGIAAVIAAAREQFPGFVFRLTGVVDGHHDIARFSWELLGFLDRVPAGA